MVALKIVLVKPCSRDQGYRKVKELLGEEDSTRVHYRHDFWLLKRCTYCFTRSFSSQDFHKHVTKTYVSDHKSVLWVHLDAAAPSSVAEQLGSLGHVATVDGAKFTEMVPLSFFFVQVNTN